MGKKFFRPKRLPSSRPPVPPVEGGKAHIHVQVSIEFCVQSDPHGLLEQVEHPRYEAAYKQLLQDCLSDPRTRRRVILDQIALELQGIAEREALYPLLSGEHPLPPNVIFTLEDLVKPHLLPDGDYLYEGTTQTEEAGSVWLLPMSDSFHCEPLHVRITERVLPLDKVRHRGS